MPVDEAQLGCELGTGKTMLAAPCGRAAEPAPASPSPAEKQQTIADQKLMNRRRLDEIPQLRYESPLIANGDSKICYISSAKISASWSPENYNEEIPS
ncbi:MAG: hypothetical protein IID61_03855 [SAR324 cluster bacterium]|nr:hypothetical protein [SAR324 cluster bacterium]